MVCERQRVRGGEERRRGGEGGGEEGGGEGGRTYDYFKENTSSPLAKAQKLWSTTERCQVVDSFCAMREWCMILYLSSSCSFTPLFLPLVCFIHTGVRDEFVRCICNQRGHFSHPHRPELHVECLDGSPRT